MAPKRSLKGFLIVGLLIAILVPIFLIGTVFTNVLTSSLRKNIITGNEKLSQSFVHQIEEYLDQSLKDLSSLKTMIENKDFEKVHINSLLDSLRQNKDHFTNIQIIDHSGITRFVSPYDVEFVGIDQSNTNFFRQTKLTGKPYWSHTFISTQSSKPVVTITIPYIDGFITGYLSLEHLIVAAEELSRDDDMLITMTDQTSSYIVHYRDNMVFERGFDPLYETFKFNYKGQIITMKVEQGGQTMFASASLIKQTEWIIVFYQPVEKVFAPIRIVNFYMLLTAIAIIVTTTFLCIRHINSIISILSKITQSAEVIAKGHYDERITDIKYEEFLNLADQFNSMAGAIESREVELIEKEEKYRSIFSAAQDAIILIDVETGRILEANDFTSCIYGYDWKSFLELKLINICDKTDDTHRRLLEKENWQSINRHKKKDGSKIPVEVSGSYHHQVDGKLICTLIVRDITARINQEEQRQQMENQLSQARKMEAIGTLAGGIAHDFNNILGAIVGFSELSLSHASEGSKQADYIGRILSASGRAAELVKQILTFARASNREKKPVKVKEIVKEVKKLIRASIPTSITIQSNIETEAIVVADPIDLHQVLMNLCTNASHAMKESGGTLAISAKEIQYLPASMIPNNKKMDSRNYVLISVEDTGLGISKSDLVKIFDPYFTTKGVGEGSGMGLSVVQGIIHSINGIIDVKSEPGIGTTFYIYLPVSKKYEPEENNKTVRMEKGDETIIVVDDEEMITITIAKNLEALGYTVITFLDPEDAIDMVNKKNPSFDLLITDMTMPKFSGFDLSKIITEKHQDMPVILCTGFMDGVSPEKAKECGIKDFLSKPITREELSLKVRQVLDKV